MTDDRIALHELLEKGSDATFLREMIGFAANRLMELEIMVCGAGYGERTERRRNHRNGYCNRDWETRAGSVELRIPKLWRDNQFLGSSSRIGSIATIVAVGVYTDGRREVLGMTAGDSRDDGHGVAPPGLRQ